MVWHGMIPCNMVLSLYLHAYVHIGVTVPLCLGAVLLPGPAGEAGAAAEVAWDLSELGLSFPEGPCRYMGGVSKDSGPCFGVLIIPTIRILVILVYWGLYEDPFFLETLTLHMGMLLKW